MSPQFHVPAIDELGPFPVFSERFHSALVENERGETGAGGIDIGPTGAIIMGFFGAAFCIMGLGQVIAWTNPLLLLPIALFGFIALKAVALLRRGTTAQLGTPRAGKVIMWSSIGEGIGIFIVVNVLGNLGRRDLSLPGIAAVVGLHFIPMAYAIPFRAFYAVAAALVIAATVGTLLRQPTGSEVAGISAGAALWIASLAALRRGSKASASHT